MATRCPHHQPLEFFKHRPRRPASNSLRTFCFRTSSIHGTVPAMRWSVVLIAICLVACGRGRKERTLAVQVKPAASVAEPAKAAASAAEPARSGEKEIAALAVRLRIALKREGSIARALPYPVRVNTNSGCKAIFLDSATFERHAVEILDPGMKLAIATSAPDFSFGRQSLMLGRGKVWLQSGGMISDEEVVLNTSSWRISNTLCEGEIPRTLPPKLGGVWTVVSSCQISGPVVVAPKLDQITIDVNAAEVSLGYSRAKSQKCRIDRFADMDGEKTPISEDHCPTSPFDYGAAIMLRCDEQTPRRIHVGNSQLTMYSMDDLQVVELRSAAEERTALSGLRQECDSARNGCQKGLVCSNSLNEGREQHICRQPGSRFKVP
jgi:hypothetical protein